MFSPGLSPALSPARLLLLMLLCLSLLATGGCTDDDRDEVSPAVRELAERLQTGLDAMAQGDVAGAEDAFESALELDEGNALAHYNLGYLAQVRGDDDTALVEYARALATDAEFELALYNRAILLETVDVERAVADYRAVLAVNPDNAPAHVRLGYALVHLGEKREGRDLIEEGIALDPTLATFERPSYARGS